jgi:HPt (histidine-containing phosphotransfer) domain-containing protein
LLAVYPQNKLVWVRIDQVGASQKLQSLDFDSTNGRVMVLDVAYLNRATMNDKPLRTEVIGLFLSQVNGIVRNLNLPLSESDWQFITHTLKGAAAAVGAKHIAEVAAAWEHRPCPYTANARNSLMAELRGAVLAFEQAASNLH